MPQLWRPVQDPGRTSDIAVERGVAAFPTAPHGHGVMVTTILPFEPFEPFPLIVTLPAF